MPEMGPEHVALIEVLVQARVQAKLTQRELAKKLDRLQSFVGKIEQGDRHINVIEFIEFARALGVDPTKLFARVVQATGM